MNNTESPATHQSALPYRGAPPPEARPERTALHAALSCPASCPQKGCGGKCTKSSSHADAHHCPAGHYW